MQPAAKQIKCPKYPDHGTVLARPLAPEEREMRKATQDIYEVECPCCGTYEFPFDPIVWDLVRVD
ncbi:MAG: hypothetical protein ACJ8C4_01860 [Gemmataceae bacterium]